MRRSIITILLLSLLAAPTARAQSGPQLTQSVVVGGGGVSAQGSVRVEGTVGQGVVSTSSGGAFSLDGGFDATFHAVNAQPTATGQSVTTDENAPVAITLTGSDEETPSGSLVFTITVQPTHGSLSGSAPGLTYTPAGGFYGSDEFKFTVTDTGDGTAPPLTSNEATVSIDVVRLPSVSAREARVAEPASGQAQMLFTLTLDRAPNSPVSVSFNTSDLTATAGSDYAATSGTATFQPGQKVQTVAVAVMNDGAAEPDETLLLQLSNVSGGHIEEGREEATGTITAANPSGSILISELRTFGPGAANNPDDDFVELYNNSDSPVVVSTDDDSDGWGLFKMGDDCNATPVLVGRIPLETVIPARGHYLLVGSAYSLGSSAEGDSELSADIEPNSNVALFSTSNVANISSATRLDAVGFGANTGGNCALLREGNNLGALEANLNSLGQHSYSRKLCDFTPGTGCLTNGMPKDTGDNSADFMFGDTQGTSAGAGQRLAMPGPENLSSPVQSNATVSVGLLDPTQTASNGVNRGRDRTSDPANNSTYGTWSIRRTVTNNTGQPITRLRFRITDLTTYPAPPGIADLRARSSGNIKVRLYGSSVTVQGTTLESAGLQPEGGGFHATFLVPSVTSSAPLMPGATIRVHFLFGVEADYAYRFRVNVEAGGEGEMTTSTTTPAWTLPLAAGRLALRDDGAEVFMLKGKAGGLVNPSTGYLINRLSADVNRLKRFNLPGFPSSDP